MELRGVEAAAPPPEVLDAIAGARAIVIGPSNPVISIGPILAVPGMRDALRAARAPVVAVSPLVGGACSRARPPRSWRGRARCPRRASPRSTAGDRRAGRRRAHRARSRSLTLDLLMATPSRGAASRARRCASPRRWRIAERPARSCPSSASSGPSSGSAARSATAPPRAGRAMVADVLVALRRAGRWTDVLVVTREPRARVARAAAARTSSTTRPSAASRRAATLGIARPSRAARRACCWSRATARRWTPREVDELLARPARGVVVVPDRHGTGTNALLLDPPDAIAPALRPGSCERHVDRAARGRRALSTSAGSARWRSTSTRGEDLDALQDALAASTGGAAHTRGMLARLGAAVIERASRSRGLPEVQPGDDLAALIAGRAADLRATATWSSSRTRSSRRPRGASDGWPTSTPGARALALAGRARQGPAPRAGRSSTRSDAVVRAERRADLPHPPRLRVRERRRRRLQRARRLRDPAARRSRRSARERCEPRCRPPRGRDLGLVRARLAGGSVRRRDRVRRPRRRSRTGAGALTRAGRELRATAIAVADEAAAAADLARAGKDAGEPVVVVRGLERYVSVEDGPGAAALVRAREDDLFG